MALRDRSGHQIVSAERSGRTGGYRGEWRRGMLRMRHRTGVNIGRLVYARAARVNLEYSY